MENLTEPRSDVQNRPQNLRAGSPLQDTVQKPNYTPLFLAIAVGVCVFTLFTSSQTRAKLSVLLQENQKLQESIQKYENENKVLTEKIQKAEKERENLKAALDMYRKESESLGFQAKKLESKLGSISEEKSYLEEILINKNKELEKVRAQSGILASGSGDAEDIAGRLLEKEREIARLNEQNAILQSKLEKIYQTANEKINALNEAKSALESTLAEAKRTIDQEFNTVDLGTVSISSSLPTTPVRVAAQQSAAPLATENARRAPKTEGKVLAINGDHGFVVIDMGKVDRLTDKTVFSVKKKSGEVIATLNVLEIRDVMTACNVQNLKPGQRLEVNDTVSVQQ